MTLLLSHDTRSLYLDFVYLRPFLVFVLGLRPLVRILHQNAFNAMERASAQLADLVLAESTSSWFPVDCGERERRNVTCSFPRLCFACSLFS